MLKPCLYKSNTNSDTFWWKQVLVESYHGLNGLVSKDSKVGRYKKTATANIWGPTINAWVCWLKILRRTRFAFSSSHQGVVSTSLQGCLEQSSHCFPLGWKLTEYVRLYVQKRLVWQSGTSHCLHHLGNLLDCTIWTRVLAAWRCSQCGGTKCLTLCV